VKKNPIHQYLVRRVLKALARVIVPKRIEKIIPAGKEGR